MLAVVLWEKTRQPRPALFSRLSTACSPLPPPTPGLPLPDSLSLSSPFQFTAGIHQGPLLFASLVQPGSLRGTRHPEVQGLHWSIRK